MMAAEASSFNSLVLVQPPTKDPQDEAVEKCDKIASADHHKAEESTVRDNKSKDPKKPTNSEQAQEDEAEV